MKRLICIILFLSLALVFAVPAFADELPFIDLDRDGANDFTSEDGSLTYYYLKQIEDLRSSNVQLRNDVDTIRSDLDSYISSNSVDNSTSADVASPADNGEFNPLDTSDMVLQSVDVYSVSHWRINEA